MISNQLIKTLVKYEDEVVPILLKPVQFRIIKKLDKGKRLNQNEKRYLRGRLGKKLSALSVLRNPKIEYSLSHVLKEIDSCYITGLAALKYNGYGWFYDPKIIEVLNTKIQGKLRINNKTIKFIRVKTISKSRYKKDRKTGIKYATNEQIFKDIFITKNNYTKAIWKQMLSRYRGMFLKNFNKYRYLIQKEVAIRNE